MICSNRKLSFFAVLVTTFGSSSVIATNGMNLEGYGPVAAAMGGASMAYDNGTAAVMNNPATIGLMSAPHRMDVAVGNLGPDITATLNAASMSADSSATSFIMPAFGWAMKNGKMTYGVGVFAQGGMGTEFGSNSWMSNPGQQAISPNLVNRSEVGVGRALVPLTYQVTDQLIVGGSVDFVWAGMDLKMGMNEAQFGDLANPASQQQGMASGTLVDGFNALYEKGAGTGISQLHYAHFDFSNSSDFTGEAFGKGFAGKLGLTFKVNDMISIGATYHSKTNLSDLETSNATMTMAVNGDGGLMSGGAATGYTDMTIPVTGKISVNDFQWPATMGVGVAVTPMKGLMLVADVKQIGWADVMKNFDMTFTADNVATNGNFAGAVMDMKLFQNWEDQTVYSVGGSFAVTDELTVRGGANRGKNPIPSTYLNALFPAIVQNHITAGVGYKLRGGSNVDLSVTKALEAKVTSAGGVTSAHAQFNWQFMYSHCSKSHNCRRWV